MNEHAHPYCKWTGYRVLATLGWSSKRPSVLQKMLSVILVCRAGLGIHCQEQCKQARKDQPPLQGVRFFVSWTADCSGAIFFGDFLNLGHTWLPLH